MRFTIKPSINGGAIKGWIARVVIDRDGKRVTSGDVCNAQIYADCKATLETEIETLRRDLVAGGATVTVRTIRHPKFI